jgi:hypothetical protein
MYQPLKFGAFIVRPGQPVITLCQEQDLKKFIFSEKGNKGIPTIPGTPLHRASS